MASTAAELASPQHNPRTPIFKWLTQAAPGVLGAQAIKWNFTKFWVGRKGEVIKRYGFMDKPEALAKDIEAALAG